MSRAPLSARAGTLAHLRTAVRTRGFQYASVLGAAGGLVGGSAWGGPLWALLAPLAIVAVVLAVTVAQAHRAGGDAFWRGLAVAMGLDYLGRVEGVLPLTPMLAAGERRHADAWLSGRDVWGAGLWTSMRRDGDEQQRVEHTVAVVEVPEATTRFPGVYLYRGGLAGELARGGLPGLGADGRRGLERVSLESAAFAERYVLLRSTSVNPIALRELFSPTLIVYLAEHPLAPEVELCAGTVLVAVRGHHADAGTMVALVDCAREIAHRVRQECAESVAA